MVGPFIFWDQMGAGAFAAGHGVDVRPHPHIGLSTVTYLFEGTLDHKDSLGNGVRIVPGEVNLMSAGKGIVHSERTGADIRRQPSRLFGIQSWLAQPKDKELSEPAFFHVGWEQLPSFATTQVSGRVILGEFEGCVSPVPTQWETLYVELSLAAGAVALAPKMIEERALYLVSGTVTVSGATYESPRLLILRPGVEVTVTATVAAHLLLFGGAAMDSQRYIWWNFVASSVERIKEAADDWRHSRFALVAGDETEYIPLTDLPFPGES
ncbi:MAG: pirin family protein [Desulfofustis sp. PB-SRB1]|jgi:redox-sensitive bicupin YhaK (pirin superfamily)|nr:pirin family protein [Desulfofustis sp. PB-SRB1]